MSPSISSPSTPASDRRGSTGGGAERAPPLYGEGTMSGRIVVAEDDPKQAELIRLYLERDGHAVVVCGDGRSALEEVRRRQPDLVLLDVMMPRLDGLDVCRVLRYESDIPIIMLTARSTEDDMLLGLDIGADDYITKPFSPRELVARVRALLRRSGSQPEGTELVVGELRVDTRRHQVFLGGELVEVTPKEFAILAAMAGAPGRAFTRRMSQFLRRLEFFAFFL